MGFCSFLWAWNYWMIHLRISLMQMNKGLECVLGQFTDGTSWEKSSAQAEICCWNHPERLQNLSETTSNRNKCEVWHSTSPNKKVRSRPDGRNPQNGNEGRSCAVLPKHTQPASLAAWVGPKSGRCTALLSLYPTTMYSHRRERKVIRMIRKNPTNIPCQK